MKNGNSWTNAAALIGRLRVKHRTWSPSSSPSSLGYIHIRPGPIWVSAPGGRRRKQSRRPSRLVRPSDFQTGQAALHFGSWSGSLTWARSPTCPGRPAIACLRSPCRVGCLRYKRRQESNLLLSWQSRSLLGRWRGIGSPGAASRLQKQAGWRG